jgi:hypothetical protein
MRLGEAARRCEPLLHTGAQLVLFMNRHLRGANTVQSLLVRVRQHYSRWFVAIERLDAALASAGRAQESDLLRQLDTHRRLMFSRAIIPGDRGGSEGSFLDIKSGLALVLGRSYVQLKRYQEGCRSLRMLGRSSKTSGPCSGCASRHAVTVSERFWMHSRVNRGSPGVATIVLKDNRLATNQPAS